MKVLWWPGIVPALVLLIVAPRIVCAQTPPEEGAAVEEEEQGVSSKRPFDGLFGGASVRNDRKQSLIFSASGFFSYFENVSGGTVVQPGDPQFTGRATSRGGTADLRYTRRWTAAQVGASVGGGASYIPEFKEQGDPWVRRWSAAADATGTKRLGRRTEGSGSAGVSYSPYYEWGNSDFGAGTIAPPVNVPGLDFVITRAPSVTTSLAGMLSHQVSSRSSLDAQYAFRDRTFFGSQSLQQNQNEQSAGGRYRYRLRYVSLRAGYMYRSANYGTSGLNRVARHELDIGLDGSYGLGKSYALDRRTTFRFAVSPSLFAGERYQVAPGPGEEPTQTVTDLQLRAFIGGSADLTRTLGRTWAARADYVRSAGYEDGFDRPLLSNSASAGVGGLIAPRVDFSAMTAYSSGSVGFTGPNREFSRRSSIVSLRAAIAGGLAAYVQYFRYRYDFGTGVRLPLGFVPQIDREGVSAGLSFWLPVW